PQATGLDEGLEFLAVAPPDIHPVASLYGISIDSVNQAQPGEERVAELLVRRQAAHVNGDRCAPCNPIDILFGGRGVFPADAGACRVRPGTEAEPLAIGPVFQVVARAAPRARDVGNLVLREPGGL